MLADGDARHGTVNGYKHLSCRCERCRGAHNADITMRRAQRNPENAPTHGKATTYKNWNCRCAACTGAHRVESRRQRNAL